MFIHLPFARERRTPVGAFRRGSHFRHSLRTCPTHTPQVSGEPRLFQSCEHLNKVLVHCHSRERGMRARLTIRQPLVHLCTTPPPRPVSPAAAAVDAAAAAASRALIRPDCCCCFLLRRSLLRLLLLEPQEMPLQPPHICCSLHLLLSLRRLRCGGGGRGISHHHQRQIGRAMPVGPRRCCRADPCHPRWLRVHSL